MSADNVTPVRAGPKAGSPKHKLSTRKGSRRSRHQCVDALVLEEFPAEDGIRIYDALAGLLGVCETLDDCDFDSSSTRDRDRRIRLTMAAHVLSALVHNREAHSCGPYRVLKKVAIPQEEGSHDRD